MEKGNVIFHLQKETRSKFSMKKRKEIIQNSSYYGQEHNYIDDDLCYLRNFVLRGGYNTFPELLPVQKSNQELRNMKYKDVAKLWKSPHWKLFVYISSTHADFKTERIIIMEKILPKLKHMGQTYQIEVSFVDMCWGYKDDDLLLNYRNWQESKKAIEYCHDESDGIFFLSLLSSR